MDIQKALSDIINARYGKQVRQAIHDVGKYAYDKSTEALNIVKSLVLRQDFVEKQWENVQKMDTENGLGGLEVTASRGTFPSLSARLLSVDEGVSDLHKNKVDKDGYKQVTLRNLADDALKAMTGGSVAVLGEENQKVIDNLKTFLEPTANTFDKGLAKDKFYIAFASGLEMTYDNGMHIGMQKLPGAVSTLSMPSTEAGFIQNTGQYVITCYDANKNFLGNTVAISTYPVARNISHEYKNANGRHQLIVTNNNPNVVYISTTSTPLNITHTPADFERIMSNMQLEKGNRFTEFAAPGSMADRLSETKMPSGYSDLVNKLTSLDPSLVMPIKVIKSGNNIDVVTKNVTEKVKIESFDGMYKHNLIQFVSTEYQLSNGTTKLLKYSGDDIAPLKYNGQYVGANHGVPCVIRITANAHGKTAVDVGSTWKDATGQEYILVAIRDANTVDFVSKNTATDGTWSFKTDANSPFRHVSGATSNANVVVASKTTDQLRPAVELIKQVMLYDETEIKVDGSYYAEKFKIVEQYGVFNPVSILTYLINNVGKNEAIPDFRNKGIGYDFVVSNTYAFQLNGGCVVTSAFENKTSYKLDYFGGVQALGVDNPSGNTLTQYIPNTKLINGANFEAGVDITTTTPIINATSDLWASTSLVPNRGIQVSSTATGVKSHGMLVGYVNGYGVNKTRSAYVNDAFFLNSNKKQYPKLMSANPQAVNGITTAGRFYEGISLRLPIVFKTTEITEYQAMAEVDGDWYLYFGIKAGKAGWVELPSYLIGKKVEVVEADGNIIVQSDFVNSLGIKVNPIEYANVVIKLT